MNEIPEILYRYHNYRTMTGVMVKEHKYKVLKETPCGYWIELYHCSWDDKFGRKWVPKNTRKRFAYPTKEEALTSFIARKKRQIAILEGQLTDARIALAAKAPVSENKTFQPSLPPKKSLFGRLFNI